DAGAATAQVAAHAADRVAGERLDDHAVPLTGGLHPGDLLAGHRLDQSDRPTGRLAAQLGGAVDGRGGGRVHVVPLRLAAGRRADAAGVKQRLDRAVAVPLPQLEAEDVSPLEEERPLLLEE